MWWWLLLSLLVVLVLHLSIMTLGIKQKNALMWNIAFQRTGHTIVVRLFPIPGLHHFYFYILIHTTCVAWGRSLSSVKPARPQICWWWQQTPRKHLDHASPLAVCPEGTGMHESPNPWITQCVCGVICWRFTHAVANVRHFSGPDQIWWLYLLH